MKTWMLLGSVSFVLALVGLTGCGGGGSDAPAPSEGGSSTEETQTSTLDTSSKTDHRVVGVWLGVAFVDQEKLQARLAELPDQAAQQNLLAQAQTFQSMIVGTEFLADGTYTLDAEITPAGGQPSRDQSGGEWSIVEEVENMIMVRITETKEDGTTDASQKQYTFVDDDHFVWIPSLSPDLAQCDAMIAFERQVASEQIASEAETTETR